MSIHKFTFKMKILYMNMCTGITRNKHSIIALMNFVNN